MKGIETTRSSIETPKNVSWWRSALVAAAAAFAVSGEQASAGSLVDLSPSAKGEAAILLVQKQSGPALRSMMSREISALEDGLGLAFGINSARSFASAAAEAESWLASRDPHHGNDSLRAHFDNKDALATRVRTAIEKWQKTINDPNASDDTLRAMYKDEIVPLMYPQQTNQSKAGDLDQSAQK